MKHTKGPWEISKIGNNYDQYSVYSMQDPSRNIVNGAEGEANARLIAAAPEMLRACQEAHNSLRTFSDHVPEDEKGWTSYDLDVLNNLDEVITKATT